MLISQSVYSFKEQYNKAHRTLAILFRCFLISHVNTLKSWASLHKEWLTYALSIPVEHVPENTFLRPVLFLVAVSIFFQLYLDPAVSISDFRFLSPLRQKSLIAIIEKILKPFNFVKISLDLISPVYYGRDVSEILTVSSLHRKMPFVS